MSSSDSDENQSCGGKEPRALKAEKYMKTVSKQNRNRGEAYISVKSKKVMAARAIGAPCRDGCFDKVTWPAIETIFKHFWKLGNFNKQNAYLYKLIEAVPIKRRRTAAELSRRTINFVYFIEHENKRHKVCKSGFSSIFGIKSGRVKTVANHIINAGLSVPDKRGKRRPSNKIKGVSAREQMKVQTTSYNYECDPTAVPSLLPDLAERIPAPDLANLKPPRQLLQSARDLNMEHASCSDYGNEVDGRFPAYHIDNDAEDELAINQSEEDISSSVSESLNGPYLLKKETHCSTILDQLLRDDTYTDVTLTAEGQNIRAHKVVLSLSSGYFREVLDRDCNARNVVFFKDLKFDHLKNVINFIYTGEATIDAGELESFMSTAQLLDISSLADGYKNLPKGVFKKPTKSSKRAAPSTSSPRKSQKLRPPPVRHEEEDAFVNIIPEIKTEPDDVTASDVDKPGSTNETKDFDSEMDSKPDATDYLCTGNYSSEDRQCNEPVENSGNELASPSPGQCPYCSYKVERKKSGDMTKHLTLNHPTKYAYSCEYCYRIYTKKKWMISHKINCCSRPSFNP